MKLHHYKKLYAFALIILFSTGTKLHAQGQEERSHSSATKRTIVMAAYAHMPSALQPQLDSVKRQDLISAFELDGTTSTATSSLGAKLTLSSTSPRTLLLITSQVSYMELVVLDSPSEPIFLLLNTVTVPSRDTELRFFSSNWQPLPLDDFITIPTATNFIPERWINPYAESSLSALLEPLFLNATLDRESLTLYFKASLSPTLEDESAFEQDLAAIESMALEYRWNTSTARFDLTK